MLKLTWTVSYLKSHISDVYKNTWILMFLISGVLSRLCSIVESLPSEKLYDAIHVYGNLQNRFWLCVNCQFAVHCIVEATRKSIDSLCDLEVNELLEVDI